MLNMSARQLCRQTQVPSTALFYFPEEDKTGIGPTRIIMDKNVTAAVGAKVTVNWQGVHSAAEIIALYFEVVHCPSIDTRLHIQLL